MTKGVRRTMKEATGTRSRSIVPCFNTRGAAAPLKHGDIVSLGKHPFEILNTLTET